ncbi:MAG TPA: helix-turn-helix domain-containing protein [Novosphingobium sp.]
MPHGSPSAQRVIAILNFFADHPGQAFTLTDLVRSLRLSRATAHAFLTTLADAGYLYRASDKSYVLGPVLATIGDVAKSHFSPLQIVQPEIRRLADEFDAVCSAIFRERNDIVVRERATSHSNLGYALPRGARLPLRPPFGSIYFAASPPPVVEEWLAQLDPPPSAAQREEMNAGIAFVRDRGFQFNIRTRAPMADSTGSDWLFIEASEGRPVAPSNELVDTATYHLASVAAPVFGPDGDVAFVLALVGFTGEHTGARIAVMGESLRTAADRVSGFLGSRRA